MTATYFDRSGNAVEVSLQTDEAVTKAEFPWWAMGIVGAAVAIPAGPLATVGILGAFATKSTFNISAIKLEEPSWIASIRSYFRSGKTGDAAASATAKPEQRPVADYAELAARLKRVHEQMTQAAAEKLEISNCFNDLYALYGVGLGFAASRAGDVRPDIRLEIEEFVFGQVLPLLPPKDQDRMRAIQVPTIATTIAIAQNAPADFRANLAGAAEFAIHAADHPATYRSELAKTLAKIRVS